jgi:hypothetical protein
MTNNSMAVHWLVNCWQYGRQILFLRTRRAFARHEHARAIVRADGRIDVVVDYPGTGMCHHVYEIPAKDVTHDGT